MFFQHENRFRYKFFFRYCSIFKVLCAAALAADDLIIFTTEAVFVKLFFLRSFLNFSELKSFSSFSVLTGTFERSLVLFKGFLLSFQKSFFCLSAWRSSIIPHRGTLSTLFDKFFSKFLRKFFSSKPDLCQARRGSLGRKLYAYTGNCTVMPRAPSLRGLASRSDDWGSFSGGVLPTPPPKAVCVSAAGALLYIIYIIERCERSPDP